MQRHQIVESTALASRAQRRDRALDIVTDADASVSRNALDQRREARGSDLGDHHLYPAVLISQLDFQVQHPLTDAVETKVTGFDHPGVHRTDRNLVLLNKFPYNLGHLLVCPTGHMVHRNKMGFGCAPCAPTTYLLSEGRVVVDAEGITVLATSSDTSTSSQSFTVNLTDDTSDRKRKRRVSVDADVCLGCGVCVRSCSQQSITLKKRAARVITPVTNAHRYVTMAVERGKLQDLIFDNQVMARHRALAALLGAVLRLPPVKQMLARDQLKSRFVEVICRRAR